MSIYPSRSIAFSLAWDVCLSAADTLLHLAQNLRAKGIIMVRLRAIIEIGMMRREMCVSHTLE